MLILSTTKSIFSIFLVSTHLHFTKLFSTLPPLASRNKSSAPWLTQPYSRPPCPTSYLNCYCFSSVACLLRFLLAFVERGANFVFGALIGQNWPGVGRFMMIMRSCLLIMKDVCLLSLNLEACERLGGDDSRKV